MLNGDGVQKCLKWKRANINLVITTEITLGEFRLKSTTKLLKTIVAIFTFVCFLGGINFSAFAKQSPAPVKMTQVKQVPLNNQELLKIRLENQSDAKLANVETTTYLTKRGSQRIAAANQVEHVSLTPHHQTTFFFQRPTQNLVNGYYTMHLKVKTAGTVQKFTHNFKIDNHAKTMTSPEQRIVKITWAIAIILLIGVFAGICYWYYKKRKH